MARLNGKVAVVTGASKGIGAAIAEKLGSEGANVVVNYVHDKAGAEKGTEKIKQSGGNAISVQADVSKAEDIKKLFAETTRTFGNVDILVNNAGGYEFRSLESLDEAHFRKIFDLNVLGLLLTTKEAVAHMNGQGGSIIKCELHRGQNAGRQHLCVQRHQRSGRCDFARAGLGTGTAENPCQFAFARRNRDRGCACAARVQERF